MDAATRRRAVCGRRRADGLGLHRQARAALSKSGSETAYRAIGGAFGASRRMTHLAPLARKAVGTAAGRTGRRSISGFLVHPRHPAPELAARPQLPYARPKSRIAVRTHIGRAAAVARLKLSRCAIRH